MPLHARSMMADWLGVGRLALLSKLSSDTIVLLHPTFHSSLGTLFRTASANMVGTRPRDTALLHDLSEASRNPSTCHIPNRVQDQPMPRGREHGVMLLSGLSCAMIEKYLLLPLDSPHKWLSARSFS